MKKIKKIILYFYDLLKIVIRPLLIFFKYPDLYISNGVAIGGSCSFGKNVKLNRNVVIANSTINDYSYIGGFSEIKNCSIGKFCSIAQNVKIGLGIHPSNMISTYPGFYSNKASGANKFFHNPSIIEEKKVSIGHDVWIGTGSMIMDGIEIGNGAIIAAGSVVTKNVEPYEIVGGVPAKRIKYRFSVNEILILQELKWWHKDTKFFKNFSHLFTNTDAFFAHFKDRKKNEY